jgi:hypothetical protein
MNVIASVLLWVALTAITLPFAATAREAAPGGCGEYMYWKQGRCLDARNKFSCDGVRPADPAQCGLRK